MCLDVLQTLQKEADMLEEAQRLLIDHQDCLDKQKDDLKLDRVKAQVRTAVFPNLMHIYIYAFILLLCRP